MLNIDSDSCTKIPLANIRYFSDLIKDYLKQSDTINSFYSNFSDVKGFKKQLQNKKVTANRNVLVEVLNDQYANVKKSLATQGNLSNLLNENTFTITTGHQLNLFTGPLYFLYKIISTINLTEKLSKEYPDYNFVPVYWMATEDHDFDEINFFNFKGKKIQWNSSQKGAVGRFSTHGLKDVFNVLSSELNSSKNATFLKELFTNSYLEHQNLADATRFLVNELFAQYGLVIIDADDKRLKKQFIPHVKNDLTTHLAFHSVTDTIKKFPHNYKVQVNPREINMFYLQENSRERIILKEDGNYYVNNTALSFSKEELFLDLEQHPENYSPNVIMRPLYQEVILPNLCYIGGAGELAYWFELKSFFDKSKIDFPILLLRNSVQFISEKQDQKLKKLNISYQELFLTKEVLVNSKVLERSSKRPDFTKQKEFLKQQFDNLKSYAELTDKSFIGAVQAQEKKQIWGLSKLEKKWLRAEKKNQSELVDRIKTIHHQLLPNQNLEERQRNLSEIFQEHGMDLIYLLKDNLNPLEFYFTILKF